MHPKLAVGPQMSPSPRREGLIPFRAGFGVSQVLPQMFLAVGSSRVFPWDVPVGVWSGDAKIPQNPPRSGDPKPSSSPARTSSTFPSQIPHLGKASGLFWDPRGVYPIPRVGLGVGDSTPGILGIFSWNFGHPLLGFRASAPGILGTFWDYGGFWGPSTP